MKKGLGRGLESLIPKKTVQKSEQQIKDGQVVEVLISNIAPNKYQPREIMDKDGLDDLAKSIKEHGVIQPLVVSKADGDNYDLLAGERRLRASKIAGLKKVPAIIRSATDQQRLEVAIVENVQRKNLNPLEEAKSYQRLADEFNLSQDQIAKKVGKNRSSVANIMRILNLPDEIKEAINSEKISLGHAKLILGLSDEAEQMKLFKAIISGNLSVKDTEKTKKQVGTKKKIKVKNVQFASYEDSMRENLGTKVDIKTKGKGGEIVISYYSTEELDGLMDKLASKSSY